MAKILVVDDESNIRLMVRLGLQADGHAVETASDGLEALERFSADFDLTLLDQRMPGMEGLEVLRAMRGRNPSARVVMITAFGTIDLATEALRSGATDFLRKPFTLDVLRASVAAALADAAPQTKPEPDAASHSQSFDTAAINGFRIVGDAEVAALSKSNGVRHGFRVKNPQGQMQGCEVLFPAHVVELVKAHADCDRVPDAPVFWRRLCEESLANYLWQNAELPPSGELRVDELTSGLRRWVDALL